MRAARRGDTAEIEGLPVGGGPGPGGSDATPPSASRRARVEGWGQRFGWMAAVALSVIALILATLAFANSGTTTAFAGRGRGYFAPYGGNGGAYRQGGGLAPGFGQPQ